MLLVEISMLVSILPSLIANSILISTEDIHKSGLALVALRRLKYYGIWHSCRVRFSLADYLLLSHAVDTMDIIIYILNRLYKMRVMPMRYAI